MRSPSILAVVSLVLVVLAGCAMPVTHDTSETQKTTAGLGSVSITNTDDAPHTVDVLVERNGSVAYWTTRHVAAKHNDTLGSAVVASGTFVNSPGHYVIRARLDNETTGRSYTLDSRNCTVAGVQIEADGSVTFLTAKGAYECRNA